MSRPHAQAALARDEAVPAAFFHPVDNEWKTPGPGVHRLGKCLWTFVHLPSSIPF